jgi:hypothetical protein
MTETPTTEAPAAFSTTVAIPVSNPETGERSAVTVVAEPTETPGLVITPGLSGGGFSGSWSLTHASSGHLIPVMGWYTADLWDVKAVAKALGATPVDWTADYDGVKAQIAEHKDAIHAAMRDARYPAPEPDGPDAPKDNDVAPYPRTDAQATADALARNAVRAAQFRCAETWNLIKRDDQDGRAIYRNHAAALVAEWALALVLREFAEVDQRAADHAAMLVWQGWEDGETVHTRTWEWARSYGLPEIKDDEEEAPAPAAEPVVGDEKD